MGFKILVIDDEATLRDSLQFALSASGYDVRTARSGEEGWDLFQKEGADLVLLDHWLPGINGDQVLASMKEAIPEVPVIIMTAQGSVELAVQAMKMGAFDFLVKPFELDQVEALVQKGLERTRLKKEVEWLRAQYQEKFRAGGIIGVSLKMKEVVRLAETLARSADTTVLIEGETGTGKELLAEYIHSLSPRSSAPFIPINCGAFPQDLLESELFGYEKGAFTGASEKGKMGKVEAAEKGTLFLDEVGELPPPAQVKVLRVLEEKEYFKLGSVEKKKADVRFIAATNKDLKGEVKKGKFRDDLYFRLNVVRLYVPPLRDRRGIFRLSSASSWNASTNSFRKGSAGFPRRRKHSFSTMSGRGTSGNCATPWNGSSSSKEARSFSRGILPSCARQPEKCRWPGPSNRSSPPRGIVLDSVMKEYIQEALKMKKGNKIQAARLLGISRSALIYRMGKYGIKDL
ncbi:MAG: sigma-54-dependent transcriptional regulator [Planctomycetaceae bacterium]